jgi:hypothetical protein
MPERTLALSIVIPNLFTRSSSMSGHAADHLKNDSDRGKGSLEPDERKQEGNNSMHGQLPHRNPHPMAEGADSDFPEPGQSPEHSFGEKFEKKSA